MAASPLTGFQVQSEHYKHKNGITPLMCSYRDLETIGEWYLTSPLFARGFGRLSNVLFGDENIPQLEYEDIRKVRALASSRIFQLRGTTQRALILSKHEYDKFLEQGRFDQENGWRDFVPITVEELHAEASELGTEERALKTLRNFGACKVGHNEEFTVSPPNSNTYDVPNDPLPPVVLGQYYAGGIVYGAVQKQAAIVLDHMCKQQWINMRGLNLDARGIVIRSEGHVKLDEIRAREKMDLKEHRMSALVKLYELASGKADINVDFRDVARNLEQPDHTVRWWLRYWGNRGELSFSPPAAFKLTQEGINEVDSINKAKEPPIPSQIMYVTVQGGSPQIAQTNLGAMNQTYVQNLPDPILKDLANGLAAADGGNLSHESSALLSAASAGRDELAIISAAKGVLAKGDSHKSILNICAEALTKKIAEKGADKAIDLAVAGGTWIHQHGPVVVAAIECAIRVSAHS